MGSQTAGLGFSHRSKTSQGEVHRAHPRGPSSTGPETRVPPWHSLGPLPGQRTWLGHDAVPAVQPGPPQAGTVFFEPLLGSLAVHREALEEQQTPLYLFVFLLRLN